MRRLRRRMPPFGSYRNPFWHLLVNVVAANPLFPRRWSSRLLRFAGMDVQGRFVLRPGVFFATKDITFADHVFIQNGAKLISYGGITFGSGSGVSYDTVLMTVTHEIRGPKQRASPEVHMAPIHIGDGVWVGAGCFIGPGVTIGEGCVIAAGAVVMRDCEPNGVYFGNPARRVRDLPLEDPGPGSLAGEGFIANGPTLPVVG